MPKSFRPWNLKPVLLLPLSPVDWLPENYLDFLLLDLASQLDLEPIYAVHRQRDPCGEKAYAFRMMVVLLLYAYCIGLPSSRKIDKACWEDAAFSVLSSHQNPDHSRISDVRRGSPRCPGRLARSCAQAVLESGASELWLRPAARHPAHRCMPIALCYQWPYGPCRSRRPWSGPAACCR